MVDLTIGIVIRPINSLKEKTEDEKNTTVPTPKNIQLLSDIRGKIRRSKGVSYLYGVTKRLTI